MSIIDLHIHSSYSDDGELTPREIVAMAKRNYMDMIAITDHNSVKGIKEAMDVADGIKVISGVELDCTYEGNGFHLLGYNFDYERKEFEEIAVDIYSQEIIAAEKKIKLFREATGIPLDTQEVLAKAEGGIVTGELIGELLLGAKDAAKHVLLHPYLAGGEKSDMPNVRFYWDYFAQGKAAYVPISYIGLEDAIALVHSAGGLAILAHPGQNIGGDDSLLMGILKKGIDGMEVFSSYHNEEVAIHYAKVAEEHKLLVTCGSDFHGKHKPNITIGGHGANVIKQREIRNYF